MLKKLKITWIMFFICGAFLLGCHSGNQSKKSVTQVSADTILSVEQMRKDLNYTVKILQEVHPATYKGFNDEQKLITKQAYDKIQTPMKAKRFYFIVNAVICSLKDGHTQIWPMTNSENKRIDTNFMWLNDGLFVTRDSEFLKSGDKILTVGGKSADEIFSELSKVIPAENDYWRRNQAGKRLCAEEYLCYLDVIRDDSVEFKIRRLAEELNVKVPLIPKSQCKPSASKRYWVSYEIDKAHSLGIFYLDSCDNNEEYKNIVRTFFGKVLEDGIKNIAIDVRQNGGGDSRVIDYFLSYVNINSYRNFGGDQRNSKISNKMNSRKGFCGIEHFAHDIQKNNNQDNKTLFNGNLYVLTSPNTFSSGNWFAVIIKDNNLGTVVGEPTGNSPSGYGDVLSFQMPNSGFWFQVSYKKWYRPNPDNDPADALYPDVIVWTTIDDIVHGRDSQIEKVKEITAKTEVNISK